MTNAQHARSFRFMVQPRTVEVRRLKLHGPNSEGVITIETIDANGHSTAVFVDAYEALAAMADLLQRVDYGEKPAR